MLSMVRFRRYQVFLVLAAVITILLFRFSHTSNWDRYGQPERLDFPSSPKDGGGHSSSKASPPEAVGGSPEDDKSPPGTHTEALAPLKAEDVNANHAAAQTVPVVVLPDRQIPTPPEMLQDAGVATDIHPVNPPGRQEFPTFSAVPTTIHWVKQPEHFPVPTESIIKLPTGAPAAIPQIQYAFKKETHDESIIRERRQSAVKKEFMKAWTGYKSQAWLHDELAPQSGKFRDPFCGWAATLVDSLDTLWIMGLEDEFEEAVNAVNQIDFTTSPRKDIPMFETTIRYLGGLLGAYDVSGAKYKSLLDKAEELADILIGAFDTPNRMPVLYYEWKPAFASQPHRAGQRSNLAELGSMTLEFTRLAQLTKEPRYYDAVARVTNALEEFQDRTRLTGIFPSNVDATGCNRTAALGPKPSPEEQPKGYESVVPKERKRPISQGDNSRTDPGSLELQILPGELTKARIDGWDENREPESSKSHLKELEGAATSKMEPRGSTEQADGKRILNISPRQVNPISGLPVDLPKSKLEIGLSLDGWDCPEQGLETSAPGGSDSFSMGGGQDSTYEYFPKVCRVILYR
jgi:mannosyl-oligosaccharide alpha-1,2-mannosidase